MKNKKIANRQSVAQKHPVNPPHVKKQETQENKKKESKTDITAPVNPQPQQDTTYLENQKVVNEQEQDQVVNNMETPDETLES